MHTPTARLEARVDELAELPNAASTHVTQQRREIACELTERRAAAQRQVALRILSS